MTMFWMIRVLRLHLIDFFVLLAETSENIELWDLVPLKLLSISLLASSVPNYSELSKFVYF